MKPLYAYAVLVGGVVLVGSLIAGCAKTNRQATVQCGNDYACLSDMAFKYQQEADQMSALAHRYEIEATAMTDAETAKQRRERAQAYWSQANEADEMAHEYRSQLPHNMAH
jgi:hypothetical protein